MPITTKGTPPYYQTVTQTPVPPAAPTAKALIGRISQAGTNPIALTYDANANTLPAAPTGTGRITAGEFTITFNTELNLKIFLGNTVPPATVYGSSVRSKSTTTITIKTANSTTGTLTDDLLNNTPIMIIETPNVT